MRAAEANLIRKLRAAEAEAIAARDEEEARDLAIRRAQKAYKEARYAKGHDHARVDADERNLFSKWRKKPADKRTPAVEQSPATNVHPLQRPGSTAPTGTTRRSA